MNMDPSSSAKAGSQQSNFPIGHVASLRNDGMICCEKHSIVDIKIIKTASLLLVFGDPKAALSLLDRVQERSSFSDIVAWKCLYNMYPKVESEVDYQYIKVMQNLHDLVRKCTEKEKAALKEKMIASTENEPSIPSEHKNDSIVDLIEAFSNTKT